MDVDGIGPGADFTVAVREAIKGSAIVLVVIGKQWLSIKDGLTGESRLFGTNDLVRAEIEEALTNDKVVVPVLLDDAQMPDARDLPVSIRSLTTRNAVTISHSRFGAAVRDLVADLTKPTFQEVFLEVPPGAEAPSLKAQPTFISKHKVVWAVSLWCFSTVFCYFTYYNWTKPCSLLPPVSSADYSLSFRLTQKTSQSWSQCQEAIDKQAAIDQRSSQYALDKLKGNAFQSLGAAISLLLTSMLVTFQLVREYRDREA